MIVFYRNCISHRFNFPFDATVHKVKSNWNNRNTEGRKYHCLLLVFRNNLMKRPLQELNAFVVSLLFSWSYMPEQKASAQESAQNPEQGSMEQTFCQSTAEASHSVHGGLRFFVPKGQDLGAFSAGLFLGFYFADFGKWYICIIGFRSTGTLLKHSESTSAQINRMTFLIPFVNLFPAIKGQYLFYVE